MAQKAQQIQLTVKYGFNADTEQIFMQFSHQVPNFIMTERQCEAAIWSLQDALAQFRKARESMGKPAPAEPPAAKQ